MRPWQTESYSECQDDLLRVSRASAAFRSTCRGASSAQTQRHWVLEGEGSWEDKLWYGVRRFFAWLETKAYKMHIRVLLSKYRAYTPCTTCNGARLKTDALLWRLGTRADADAVLDAAQRFAPAARSGAPASSATHRAQRSRAHAAADRSLPAHSSTGWRCRRRSTRRATWCCARSAAASATCSTSASAISRSIASRARLSGGEVQRINLTTALGTSLVNTLFVLDEPSIGLHPRDMGRVIEVMRRLRGAGNSLVVVEHDPQVMQAADRILDIGPGPGERGGEIVFFGTPAQLAEREAFADRAVPDRARKSVDRRRSPRGGAVSPPARRCASQGAREHNLKEHRRRRFR